ncbi:MAG: DUF4861 family protein [Catalinimonas sp.]
MRTLICRLLLLALPAGCAEKAPPPASLAVSAPGLRFFARAALSERLDRTFGAADYPLLERDGTPVPYQFVGEGERWDSVAYLFADTGTYTLRTATRDALPPVEPRVNLRFAREPDLREDYGAARLETSDSPSSMGAFQMEGPAWENEYVAFRNYYDARNGIDVFGKRVRRPVLDSVGTDAWGSYHQLADWGMDILRVGNSLGAGALALARGDSLYRVGPGCEGSIERLAEGPLYAAFRLRFRNCVGGVGVDHTVSIRAGDRYYTSEVRLQPREGTRVVTGLVSMENDTLYRWDVGEHAVLATYGNQAYDGERLGMALITDRRWVHRVAAAPDSGAGIVQTHLLYLDPDADGTYRFCVYAAWELENSAFGTLAGFRDLLTRAHTLHR